MSDLISRKETIRAIDSLGEDYISYYKLLMLIGRLPSVEPERTVEVKRLLHYGEIMNYDIDGECECGKCVDALWDYCPSCGAKLKWSK